MEKRTLYLFGGVAAAVGLLVASQAFGGARAAPKGSKILLLGDSLAVGLAPRLKQLAEGAGYAFVGAGVSGSTSSQWEDRVPTLLASERPSLVLVSLGTNDGAGDTSKADLHIGNIAHLVSAGAPTFVWILPPSMPSRLDMEPVRASVSQYAKNVIDSRAMSFPVGSRAADGIHFDARGYASWAEQGWQKLLDMGLVTS